MNPDCGIYAITSPSGKQYIGQAKSIKKRWMDHRYSLRRGVHHCEPLQHAWNKYGEEEFIFSVLTIVRAEDLNRCEQEYLGDTRKHMLYNVALVAGSPMRGRKHTLEERARRSTAMSGEKNHQYGRKFTDAQIANMSAAQKGKRTGENSYMWGRKRGPETIEKLSGANNPVAKAVVCLETRQTFVTVTCAMRWLHENGWPKAQQSAICRTSSGKRPTAYGYRWAYADSYIGALKY